MLYFRLVCLLAATTLAWGQRPELRDAKNLGVMADEERLDGISLRFALSADKQQELDQFLEEVHQVGSPQFHLWLSPEQYADRFGLSDAELRRVEGWLRAQGLKVDHRARTRSFVVASGTVRQVKRAFSTEFRRYEHQGKRHFASARPIRLPEEIASLVQYVDGLDDFLPEPSQRQRPKPDLNLVGGQHILAPDDYAVIYNIQPALQRGIDGSGQRIVVVGQSSIDLSDMRQFRTRFNLTPNDPDVILYSGSREPGFTDSQPEANLDLQWAGAIARNARLIYVYGVSAIAAASFAIDQKLAPVVSVSFSAGCEAQNSQGFLSSLRNLVQTANAMGITWVNSSGDAGPAGCDPNSASIAQNGYGPRIPASIPEVTAIGGTELNDREGNYWRGTNDANLASALSYIPEIPWNESQPGVSIASGGGGVSSFFERPLWQPGSDRFRRTPDISLAGSTYNGYAVIDSGRLSIFGGTSAGTPAFAAMLALVMQGTNQTNLGNVNRLLYPLAQSSPDAFHDVISGNTLIPCALETRDCSSGRIGFEAGPGYDLATGLGTIDFDRLLAAWPRQPATQSLVTLSTNRSRVYSGITNGGPSWTFILTLKEHAGVATTIASFKIDGQDNSAQIGVFFGATTLEAGGLLNASILTRTQTPPVTITFEISGRDASGFVWTQTLFLPILGVVPAPAITGVANGASFAESFAPGAIVSVFGRNLAELTQAAAAVPLRSFAGGVTASVNGVTAPFYYVSPSQINLQIPYSTQTGSARLTISYPQAGAASVDIPVRSTAPGIFTNGDLFTVPQTSCGRGQTCILYVTGQGAVEPTIATGAAPSTRSTLETLPRPIAPVSMTIGDVPATVVFAGIPPALVGLIQVNFTVAANTPVGAQRVVVRVGTVDSPAARIEVF